VAPGLTVKGGARRLALNMSTHLGDSPEVSRKPRVWDPLAGLTQEAAGQEMAARPARRWKAALGSAQM